LHPFFTSRSIAVLGGIALLLSTQLASAQEAAIRKALTERVPQMPAIDEVSKTPMPGLYEVRSGSDVFYTDAKGDYVIQGELLDTRKRVNLTEERRSKLSAIDFSALPQKDAFKIVRGNGERKLAVFEDPNCGYCRRFEKDLQTVDNITVYLYLYPILGKDSVEKAHNHWCAKDKGMAWEDWMLRDKAAPAATCDTTAVERNVAFGRKYRITGTPTLIFSDGTRVAGAIPAAQLEKRLASAK
jgi:thiol:disulfide interchange protein DsbC